MTKVYDGSPTTKTKGAASLTINTSPPVDNKKAKPGHPEVELKSPTSVEMQNSFIIQNQNPCYDVYAAAMRRKKGHFANTGGAIFGLSLVTG